MVCSKCQHQNEEGAQFCRNCGNNLYLVQEPKRGNDISSILLIIYIFVGFLTTVAEHAILHGVEDLHSSTVIYVRGSIWIISGLSLILPALAIKNNSLKIVGIIIASLLIIYRLYYSIEFLLR